ncbi:hypothetical protein FHL15_010382 [Xylaria flabelliformis]|uniref:Uncharacterized protein n=1 Tax=Xylaria flabelliformis TaxID=2512241 RepID=A0A553HL84_9PEZI|nr:hypothetical protein FHL15_010382 [Xylaria flabelliformis]
MNRKEQNTLLVRDQTSKATSFRKIRTIKCHRNAVRLVDRAYCCHVVPDDEEPLNSCLGASVAFLDGPATQATSSDDTTDNPTIVSNTDERSHGVSSGRESTDDAQRASNISADIITGAGPSRLSHHTPANKSKENLVNALIELNLKSLFNDMASKSNPTIHPTGSVDVPPPSDSAWRLVDKLGRIFASHDHRNDHRKPASRVSKNTKPDQHKMTSANASNLLDRHELIIAAILTRFRNMVNAACAPLPTAAAIPQASLNIMTMNNEAAALIKEIENLLALNREIKQLWITGPLRKPGDADEKNLEKVIDERAANVSKLYNTLVELQSEAAKRNPAQQPQQQQQPASVPEGQNVDVKQEKGDAPVKQEYQGDSA